MSATFFPSFTMLFIIVNNLPATFHIFAQLPRSVALSPFLQKIGRPTTQSSTSLTITASTGLKAHTTIHDFQVVTYPDMPTLPTFMNPQPAPAVVPFASGPISSTNSQFGIPENAAPFNGIHNINAACVDDVHNGQSTFSTCIKSNTYDDFFRTNAEASMSAIVRSITTPPASLSVIRSTLFAEFAVGVDLLEKVPSLALNIIYLALRLSEPPDYGYVNSLQALLDSPLFIIISLREFVLENWRDNLILSAFLKRHSGIKKLKVDAHHWINRPLDYLGDAAVLWNITMFRGSPANVK
ncbi:hypothetical protein GYMLUDRAFT_253394 [Collybiopsis luxurians FD-317 M1]|uniref:Uncharacterized protein n=1 Tax=Collybiopsis luxurians FD-317 M1 TaxID=944289 RepID=A0A0D0AIM1_9AGAR|nr:hypothetical protein GYMLUDRAFT_253394 [Collybiopsis luxurians FD-317 M1]